MEWKSNGNNANEDDFTMYPCNISSNQYEKKKTNFPGDSDESTNSDLVAIIESNAAVCCSRIAQTKIEMLVKI